jgi:hypothetical protein
MGAADFEKTDRRGAVNFASAAAEADVERLIYLGGLGEGDDLSPHLPANYDLVTIRDWPVTPVAVDLIWGTALSAAVAIRAYSIY